MALGDGLNAAAKRVLQEMCGRESQLNVMAVEHSSGATLLDCGVEVAGGIDAGLQFASICMAGRASVSMVAGDRSVWPGAWVQVTSDHAVEACMLGQYAGWPVQHDKFFAMGSGPMRVRRGKEPVLEHLHAADQDAIAVGTLECDCLPGDDVLQMMAQQCNVPLAELYLAIAPTRSVAGCVQVVARSVETSLHKLHELGFPLSQVRSAYGVAPLPTPTPNFAEGIGRTNDAILYGGHVSLWLEGDDEQISELGRLLPSSASRDYGAPFAEIFERYQYDFYKVDPALFSPAEITLMNLSSGRSWRFGGMREDLIARSFATELA